MKGVHDPKMMNYDPTNPDKDKTTEQWVEEIQQLTEPWCYEGGGQAEKGECPTHHGDACLRTPEGLVEMIQLYQKLCDYHNLDITDAYFIPYPYDPEIGDDKLCKCGHPYHRHFDSYENMKPVGCKYCQCIEFIESQYPFVLGVVEPKTETGLYQTCPRCFANCFPDLCDQQLWWVCQVCDLWVSEVDLGDDEDDEDSPPESHAVS